MNSTRVAAIVSKESKEILRDPILVSVCILLPVVMLFLFGYGVSLDVDDVALGVLDFDQSPDSRALVDAFAHSGYFRVAHVFQSRSEIEAALRRGEIRTAIVIPKGIQSDLVREETADVQLLVDGTHSATALIVGNYARSIVIRHAQSFAGSIQLRTRVWYNPALRSINYFVPGLYAVILMSFPPLMTTLGIVREKESGAVQQIFASPVRSSEYILGKLIPYGSIAFLQILLVMATGYIWFRVPMQGNLWFLLTASIVYVFCTVGIGLLISTLTKSQLVAMLAAYMVALMPSYLLSGFLFPIFAMPYVLRLFTHAFPTRYFIETSRDVTLKGAGFEELWTNVLVLLLYTIGVFVLAAISFKKKVA